MSETTNLAPACVGTDLWSHIRSQLWTTVPAVTIAAVLFAVLGPGDGGGKADGQIVSLDNAAQNDAQQAA